MSSFDGIRKLMKSNPVFQFAQKAQRKDRVMISDAFSPSAVSLGIGQKLRGNSDPLHTKSVERHNLHLNMMRFNMNQGVQHA